MASNSWATGIGSVIRVVGNNIINFLLHNREFARTPACTLVAAGFDPGIIDLAKGYWGLQEETMAPCVPCFTLRKTTEHPITVEQRTNTMVGRDTEAMRRNADAILARHGKEGRIPEMWDGHAAERITRDLGKSLLDQHQVKKSA